MFDAEDLVCVHPHPHPPGMFGAEDLVCATGTLYRNRACAGCNYELQSTVFDGYCPAAIANDDTISSCRGLPAQTNRTVQQNRSFSECHQGVEERVCYNHQNFRNFGCARCNGVQIPPNWPAGDCATVLAVSPDTISVDAGCERWELCGYEHENCTCTGMVRYDRNFVISEHFSRSMPPHARVA